MAMAITAITWGIKRLDCRPERGHGRAMGDVRFTHYLKIWLLIAAGLAFATQAMIPAGFMPGSTKEAGRTITICSGFEQKTIHLDGEETPYEQDAPCAFAFVPLSEKPSAPALPVLVLAQLEIAPSFNDLPYIYGVQLERAHPPTGPPILL